MNHHQLAAQTVLHSVFADGNTLKTNSRMVADFFGKPHKDVLEKIRKLEVSEEFSRRNFSPREYLDVRGQMQPMYDMTFDGFTFVVMGFTGAKAAAFKEAYIAEFNRMRTQLNLVAQERIAFLEKYARLPVVPLTLEIYKKAEQYVRDAMPIADIARTLRISQATVRQIKRCEITARQFSEAQMHLAWAAEDEANGDLEGARLNRQAAESAGV